MDTFDCARDQWLQDGAGTGPDRPQAPGPRRLACGAAPAGHRPRGGPVAAPRAALPAVLGRLPAVQLPVDVRRAPAPARHGLSVGGNAAWLTAARVAPMVTGFLFWALAALVLPPAQIGMGSAVVAAALLTVQLGMLGVGPATLTLLPGTVRRRPPPDRQQPAYRRRSPSACGRRQLAAVTTGSVRAWARPGTIPPVTVIFLATALFAAGRLPAGPRGRGAGTRRPHPGQEPGAEPRPAGVPGFCLGRSESATWR